MEETIKSVLQLMSSIKKPQMQFMLKLFSVLSTFQGKANYRNLSRYSNVNEKTFSRWYRRAFDFAHFNTLLLLKCLPKDTDRIAAIDASFITKSGKHTEGLGWFYNGCQGKTMKGLEISTVALVDIESNTAYSLDTQQTLDAKVKNEVCEESRINQYAEQVVRLSVYLKSLCIKYLAQDAYYSKKKFINKICAAGFHVVGKLRRDVNLKYLFSGLNKGRGRPRKYDGKVDVLSDLSRWVQENEIENTIEVYSQIVWSVCFQCNIKVVILRRRHEGSVGQAILFSTDPNLDTKKLITYYKARFQIEFIFRDAKQYTGLTDSQSRCKEAIHCQVNASLSSLNLLKIQDRERAEDTGQKVISIASWKRRRFNQHLMRVIFDKLGIDQSCQKISHIYHELSEYGAIAS